MRVYLHWEAKLNLLIQINYSKKKLSHFITTHKFTFGPLNSKMEPYTDFSKVVWITYFISEKQKLTNTETG